jgi:hypothetical protein
MSEEVVALESQELTGEGALVRTDDLDTAIEVLSYAVFVGTPPKNENAATCPAWKVSVHSRGYAETKKASGYGNVITASAAFTRIPSISTVASPKSNCASPGGCESGMKTSALTRRCCAT